MKFRFFLRGLGMGILLTSIVFYIAYWQNKPAELTDSQIRQRAKELGMVEKENPVGDLLPAKENASEDETPISAQDMLAEQESAEASVSEEVTMDQPEENSETSEQAQTEAVSSEQKTTETESQEQEETPTTADTVSITIKGGTSSMTICQNLQKAGLIENATEFDTYLIENGYASRIRAGTYDLKMGMSFQDLAESISRSSERR